MKIEIQKHGYSPYMITLPFNRSTYTGYSSSLLSQMMTGYSYILTLSAVSLYFIVCCFYIEAKYNIFKYRINYIDERIKSGDKSAEVFFCVKRFS